MPFEETGTRTPMRLVLRRIAGARWLLCAAGAVCLITVTLFTALVCYGPAATVAGTRAAVASAPARERSLLIRGNANGLDARDAAVRHRFAGGLGGIVTDLFTAGYATGRQLTGPIGQAATDQAGMAFASVTFLDDLAANARLVEGRWPVSGSRHGADGPAAVPVPTTEATIGQAAARRLGYRVGDRVAMSDRLTDTPEILAIVGIWQPLDLDAAYWRLVPEVSDGQIAGSVTYGPFVLDRQDFMSAYAPSSSAGWLVEPRLGSATTAQLAAVRPALEQVTADLATTTGLGDSAVVSGDLGPFVDRLRRANLVGRSAQVTPTLLVVVLAGYTLVMVAGLLAERRSAQDALLRVRGAGPGQLAALAAAEAALVTMPAVLVGPLLATLVLRGADRLGPIAGGALAIGYTPGGVTWFVAGMAGLGCAIAMVLPAVQLRAPAARTDTGHRRGGVALTRAGFDLLVLAIAWLCWSQLRHSTSPLVGTDGQLGIDPLLAAAPIVPVLAGAVLAMRPLPLITGLAQRLLDNRRRLPWAMLAAWQAGRRSQAGPALLLAIAVTVSTMAWCVASTTRRSMTDQANHEVGADLRVVETGGPAPDDRQALLRRLPGVGVVAPVWRESVQIGARGTTMTAVAMDTTAASGIMQIRGDLTRGPAAATMTALADATPPPVSPQLPSAAAVLTGRIEAAVAEPDGSPVVVPSQDSRPVLVPVRSCVVVQTALGTAMTIPLAPEPGGRFAVTLPLAAGRLRLLGFTATAQMGGSSTLRWQVDQLATEDAAAGTPTVVELGTSNGWQVTDGRLRSPAVVGRGSVLAAYKSSTDLLPSDPAAAHQPATGQPASGAARRESTTRSVAFAPVWGGQAIPLLATPQALAAMGLEPNQHGTLQLDRTSIVVRAAATIEAMPGTSTKAAVLLDLRSLNELLFSTTGQLQGPKEWWLTCDEASHATAAAMAGALRGLEVLDRRSAAADSAADPYGVASRTALFLAALGALVLAGLGVVFEIGATARRRSRELSVLNLLGAGPRLLVNALLAEQGMLAVLGIATGLGVGLVTAMATSPLVVITPSASRPVPQPLVSVATGPVLASAAVLFGLTMLLSGGVAAAIAGRRLDATAARFGQEG